MKPLVRNTLILVVAAAAGFAGYLARDAASPSRPAPPQVARDAGAPILALELPDSNGQPQALAQWRGKVLVVNFWATWCPPCLREIPEFAAVSRRFADAPVQFVGIGIDQPDNVRRFAEENKVPYPLLIAPLQTLAVTSALGNTSQALPFTAIFDRQGELDFVKLGTLNEAELEGKIRALLASR
ncbi:TlpA family protein disulfide reductase [Aromatoleum toluclasticum]|uniref:TlpA family protein disulfide reductase n=1 Tax=Aromatoleum toluclasticum TaxID=92003 RepID=UPI001D19274B|nr:TlpA disulfide reductase family protein [Aromatoleum toluclasticum]MCC4117924.1 TlpA family protein disulfide reductase [Aromatoleum toluclasticum]